MLKTEMLEGEVTRIGARSRLPPIWYALCAETTLFLVIHNFVAVRIKHACGPPFSDHFSKP